VRAPEVPALLYGAQTEEVVAGRRNCHTINVVQKIAVTLDRKTVADLDRWVREGKYPNRSRALQSAVDMLSERDKRTRLARELAKLDPNEEKQLADEGLGEKWPEY
jgi:Arc/MetJ-type ribon-helix-helix transcriptional regulator